MSYRNNDRDGSRRREDRNHRPFRGGGGGGGRGGRPGGRGGRPGGNHQVDTGSFRGVRINIDENTPYATDFAELGVPNKLAQGLGALGILEPFPIQAATIGDALAGKDVLGRGRTGSGKTLAFGLPLLARLMGSKSNSTKPRGMILVPTRELAMQVNDALAPLGQLVGLHFSLVIGGAQYNRQIDSLARGADIVVATPGRLEDLIKRGACDLSEVEIAVLDEADQMADMGFLPIVNDLMDFVPRGGQRLLFSATLDRGVDAIVRNHLSDPVEHATEPNAGSVTTMAHHVFLVEPRDKFAVIRTIATREGRCIAFVRTQRAADEICDELNSIGVRADALHGGKSQGARNKALQNLKNGSVSILVATDVAARGIHVDDIDLVLNVDLPRDFKDYLHRAGRTARAGAEGLVISVASVKQNRMVKQLMDKAGVDPEYHRVRAEDDVVAELAGARDVVLKRPGNDDRREDRGGRDNFRRDDRRDDRPRGDFRREDRGGADSSERDEIKRELEQLRRERDELRKERESFSRDSRPAREDRPARDDRPRGDFRRDDRNDRPRGEFRRDDRNDRPRGEFRRDDRRDDRGGRDGGFRRDDRRDDRPRGDFRRDDRPRGDFRRDDRPRDDRFSRDDRPRRDSDRERREGTGRDARRKEVHRASDRHTAAPSRRAKTEPATGGSSASNRKARRAHLQWEGSASSKPGRKGKPRPKHKGR